MDSIIDLWLWPLDIAPAARAMLQQHLCADERARARAFRFAHDRDHFITARGRLREILAARLGTAPTELCFTLGAMGKPHLAGGPEFNLSHSGGWAALAISPGPPIGIDIEAHRPVDPGMAAQIFSATERQTLNRLAGAAWRAAFFCGWTRKEALLKAHGCGLHHPPASIEVTLASQLSPRVLRFDAAGAQRTGWQLLHLDLGPEFSGAIALASHRPARVVYHLNHPPLIPSCPKPGARQTR